MVLDRSVLAFALAATLVALSPGPDTFLVITNAARGGVQRGLATVAGILTGGFFFVAVFALGVAQVLVYSPALFWTVKVAGAAYLMWLGLGAMRSALRRGDRAGAASSLSVDARPVSSGRAWLQGLMTNALNPKVAVFYLAFLPQFIGPGDSIPLKSALLIGIHYGIGGVWLSLVSLAVSRMSRLVRGGGFRRALDGTVGLVMTGFGVRLVLATR